MTLKKAYNEIMEKINVTDEMKARILDNLQSIDIERPSKQLLQFSTCKKYLSIAACFAFLLIGIIAVPHFLADGQVEPPVELGNPAFNMVEVDSLQELSEAVGFEVADAGLLPFEVTNTRYMAYGQDLAEITYSGDGQTAVFRKSIGREDNSGDFNVYEESKEMTIDTYSVSLKGSAGEYVLATWSNGEFSYSLQLSSGISEAKWGDLVSTID